MDDANLRQLTPVAKKHGDPLEISTKSFGCGSFGTGLIAFVFSSLGQAMR